MKLTTFFLLLLFLTPLVSAGAGIRLPSLEERTFFFTPGAEYEFNWYVHRAASLDVYLGGGLAKYAELDDPDPKGGPRYVTITMKLPDELTPGKHALFVYAEEIKSSGPSLGGVARVAGSVYVISVFPDPYLEFSMESRDVAEGGNATIELDFTSWSAVESNVYVDLKVLSPSGELVVQTETDLITIPSRAERQYVQKLMTHDFSPGLYKVFAEVKGAQSNLNATDPFKIGSFDIGLYDYSKKVYVGEVNKFSLTLESRWNEHIENVRSRISFLNVEETTVSIDLAPFARGQTTTFLDLRETNQTGTIDATVSILYASGNVREVPIQINLLERPVLVEESPGFVFELNTITGLYIILVLLIIINVVVLLRKKE